MKFATIAFYADGSTELLLGPEVKPSEQRAAVQRLRNGNLPDGVDRVEIWERSVVKLAVRQPALPLEEPEDKTPATPKTKPAAKAKAAAKPEPAKVAGEQPPAANQVQQPEQ